MPSPKRIAFEAYGATRREALRNATRLLCGLYPRGETMVIGALHARPSNTVRGRWSAYIDAALPMRRTKP